jgi:predicted amidohydrolase
MKFCLALLLACSCASAQIYDLLLKNGRVIDPANHRDAQLDVAVTGKSIVRVASNLPASHARVVVDVGGYIVTPGLIDINVHFGDQLKPDYNTLPYGVTTAVDVGSATCQTFSDFKKRVMDHAKVRVLSDAKCPENRDAAVVSQQAPTISSGMAWENVLLPRANMATAMSIFLNRGMTVEQIIERVTSNPARAIKRAELGALNEAGVADIAVFEIEKGKFGFLDSNLKRLDGTRRFRCLLTVRSGAIVWDSDGLSVPDTIRAGPYTNFK